jgi:hypothetical protein
MNENEMKENLILLDEYRKNLEVAKAIKKKFLDELDANPEYIECCKAITGLNEMVDTLTDGIKSNAVVIYSQSLKTDPETSKSLFDGNVKIQNKTIAEILDETIAFEWAKINAPQMLILDKNTLLKHAIAVKKTLPLIFVKITEKSVATIASEIKF